MLQNWPIRSKLVVILIVPLVALAVLSAIQVRGNVDSVQSAKRIKALAGFSVEVNTLIAALQTERNGTNTFVGSNYFAPPTTATNPRGAVNSAVIAYRTAEQSLPADARSTLGELLTSVSGRLDKLAAQRQLLDRREATLQQNIEYYDGVIKDLLGLNPRVAGGSHNTNLISGASTLTAISQAKEAAAQQRGNINRMFFLRQQTDPALVLQIQDSIGAEKAWLAQMLYTATDEQQQLYVGSVVPVATNVNGIRDTVLNATLTGAQQTTDPEVWLDISEQKIARMQEVERKVATDLAATADQIASDAAQDAIINSLIVALVLALSVLISLLVASPMIRQLRRLREGALEVADHRLPDVVDRLHRGDPVDIEAESFPVPATTRDEIGQVAEAFGTVHQVAVRTAIEQAAMRKSIGDTFLNLARRSQALIHRQLKIIDALERKETDPDELEELFRLDHLATRMRRHAEDLIVLSGSKPARGWRRPVPIKDVVRGAVAEVEDYTRVKVLPVGGGAISGHAVGDVIHMLAELIENATSFSPPHTPVHVTGHEVSNGFAIEIEDRGLGMNPAEFKALNDRLENPPPFDLTTSERLGLFVVGRLAERHTIKVRLRTSPYGGTMAIVLIPGTLLRQADGDSATDGMAIGPGDHDDRELAAVGAGKSTSDQTEALDLGSSAGRLALPPASSTGALNGDAPDLEEPLDPGAATGALDLMAGPPSGALSLPAPAGALSPEQLPAPPTLVDPIPPIPPELPSEDTGPRPMFGSQPARGDDEPLIDDLPVFATVRSSWFIADRPRRTATTPPPVAEDDPLLGSSSAAAAPPRPPYPGGYTPPMPPAQNPAGPPAGRFGELPARTSPRHQQPAGWAPQPSPPPQAPAEPLGPSTPAGGYAAGPGRARGGRGSQPAPQTTDVGLPRRQRRANLAPELRRDSPQPARVPQVLAGPRSPEEIRSMMSSFQSNFGRGLADAQGSSDGDDQRKVT
ncbi:nitrate- and nitrite sensing domain-containing protein [Frankia sp. CNm7]|uniref:histidine kinase n=2 Tax=Frankia nepalensis TaxID=1836974 RepID=A0A937USE2_9ACTN|nr:nitrate- and nitrite sensing domain-containing protein [Frankia nepalensis]MBL7501051.1 nitrate- and nitrite sensing domain-containing protein [Frankia nepalensis]MBL7518383.1 nitrate- and nitrite sensing domain-containing protein [Frankia nepalensis]MBL7632023.1 nitrate- and nitrite sensing domain-containing protein [Frankia nepalensis]